MLKIIISGCNGHMGRVVESLCNADPEVQVAAGFDVLGSADREFPVYSSPAQFTGEADAVIDFSSPAALEGLLEFGKRTKTPLILATTGYTPEQVAQIGAAALEVPIFRSANMSLGINVLLELVKKAASVLGDSYDIEIVERHHRRKVDAPSGTALMIADAINTRAGGAYEYVYDRHEVRQPRGRQELGISAVRGGGIVGDHDVLFCGPEEVVTLSHRAQSRGVFADGAVQAALFVDGRAPGYYTMSDLLRGKLG